MPGIGLPYSTQSHISCPDPNAGRSGRPLDPTSFSPASVSRWRKTSGSDAWNSSGGGSSGKRGIRDDGLQSADEQLQELELPGGRTR